MGIARHNNRPAKDRDLTPKIERNVVYYYQSGEGLTVAQLAKRFYLYKARVLRIIEKAGKPHVSA